MAISAALSARPSPRAAPMPMSAVPAPDMIPFTSAKSTLMRPGVVIRSVMPCTPLSKHLVGTAERIHERYGRITHLEESVVGDHDEGVAALAKRRDADLGLIAAAFALEGERPCHHADRQRAELARDGRHDGRATGTGAAALACGDEHHVGAAEQFLDVVLGVLGGLAADLRVGACAESAGGVTTHVELDVGVAHQQCLGIGVDGDELHALQAVLDHPVDGIDAAAADADHLDDREIVVRGAPSVAFLPGCRACLRPSQTSTLNLNNRLRVMSGRSVQTER